MYARTRGITLARSAGSRASRRSGSKGSEACRMASWKARTAIPAASRGEEGGITLGISSASG
jgi:hypothetical protein